MKTLATTILILYSLNCAAASDLWLQVGESHQLPAAPSAKVRVGSRGIVRAVDVGKNSQLVGLKPGTTTVSIGTQTYQVHVNCRGQKAFALELKALISKMMGLTLETNSQVPTIGGTLLKLSDWLRIVELAKQSQGQYLFAAQALPDVAETALQHLTQKAKTSGIPVVRFRADPVFTAQLPRGVSSLREMANSIFSPYGVKVETSDLGIALQPLVRTRVIIAEVTKQNSGVFGVAWPSEYQAQVLPSLNGNAEGLTATLHALEAKGQAQVLASPNLLCRSGSEAQFHAGGEFPIRMISKNAHDVIWKQHGVLLKVKPMADFQGALSLEIESEISLLDMANAVDGIPALKTNTVKSHFDLPGRRTIAISGLLRQEIGSSQEGLPYLGRIPILGPLFSSRQYLKHQSELIIFVTPEIYIPDQDEKIEMPAGWIRNEL